MIISKLKTGPLWGLAGLILGFALSATAVGAYGLSASTSPPPDKSQTNASFRKGDATFALPQSVILPVVRNYEIDEALKSFPPRSRTTVRKEATNGTHRLLWLTAWDWDTAEGEPGNTISILSDTNRRLFKLNGHRSRIAVREPRSGYIEMHGEVTEDGNISVSVLSGTTPIALPQMPPGRAIRIKIDAQEGGEVASSTNVPATIPTLPED